MIENVSILPIFTSDGLSTMNLRLNEIEWNEPLYWIKWNGYMALTMKSQRTQQQYEQTNGLQLNELLTAWRALVIDPMDQLVCLTNKQLTCSMIWRHQGRMSCSSVEYPNKCSLVPPKVPRSIEARQQAPKGVDRWATQVSNGAEWNGANWRAARISIGIEDANWWGQRRLESTWLTNGYIEHHERWNSLHRVDRSEESRRTMRGQSEWSQGEAFRCQAWSRVNEQ